MSLDDATPSLPRVSAPVTDRAATLYMTRRSSVSYRYTQEEKMAKVVSEVQSLLAPAPGRWWNFKRLAAGSLFAFFLLKGFVWLALLGAVYLGFDLQFGA